MAIKKTIRMNEKQLKGIVAESVRRVLDEVKVDYARNSVYDMDSDWTLDSDYDEEDDTDHEIGRETEYSNVIKEDYIGFMERLERLTGTEWTLSPESYFRSNCDAVGYNYCLEDEGDILTFTTECDFGTRDEKWNTLRLIEKVAKAFFNNGSQGVRYSPVSPGANTKNSVRVGYDDGRITLTVTGSGHNWRTVTGHNHSRKISYGKDYAGYPMHMAK